MSGLKKLKRSTGKAKVTVYLSEEADRLYRDGKKNGWDTTDLATRAVEAELMAEANRLLTPADPKQG